MEKAMKKIRESVINTIAVVGIFTIITSNIPYFGREWFYFLITILSLVEIGSRD